MQDDDQIVERHTDVGVRCEVAENKAMVMRSRLMPEGCYAIGTATFKVQRERIDRSCISESMLPRCIDPTGTIERGAIAIDDGVILECLEGVWFQRVLLDLVRAEYPEVRWQIRLDVPALPPVDVLGWRAGIAYGVSNNEIVAGVSPHSPPEGWTP